MAIKGKGRTRAKQPVRAPRRGPVPVPLPFARRRGVQVVAAFLAGLLVFWGGIWLTNGLREEQRTERDREQTLSRRRAGAAWQNLVEKEVGAIGTIQPGSPPVVLPQVRQIVSLLGKGTPKDAVSTLRTAGADAKDATDAIGAFDLTGTLRSKGFDGEAVLRFLSARDELVTALSLYRQAALVGVLASGLDGQPRATAVARARDLLSAADDALTRFETHQLEALSAAGIFSAPGLPGS